MRSLHSPCRKICPWCHRMSKNNKPVSVRTLIFASTTIGNYIDRTIGSDKEILWGSFQSHAVLYIEADYIHLAIRHILDKNNKPVNVITFFASTTIGNYIDRTFGSEKEILWGSFQSRAVLFICCFFVALCPKSTAMVMAGRSVDLTTLFPGQAWTSS